MAPHIHMPGLELGLRHAQDDAAARAQRFVPAMQGKVENALLFAVVTGKSEPWNFIPALEQKSEEAWGRAAGWLCPATDPALAGELNHSTSQKCPWGRKSSQR